MRILDAASTPHHRQPLSLVPVAKLFATGATVGPVVDSIHNRCLLQYDYAPVNVEPFLHSSGPSRRCWVPRT
jgi:hypothetical protein